MFEILRQNFWKVPLYPINCRRSRFLFCPHPALQSVLLSVSMKGGAGGSRQASSSSSVSLSIVVLFHIIKVEPSNDPVLIKYISSHIGFCV